MANGCGSWCALLLLAAALALLWVGSASVDVTRRAGRVSPGDGAPELPAVVVPGDPAVVGAGPPATDVSRPLSSVAPVPATVAPSVSAQPSTATGDDDGTDNLGPLRVCRLGSALSVTPMPNGDDDANEGLCVADADGNTTAVARLRRSPSDNNSPVLRLPSNIKRVVVEVGTNWNPHYSDAVLRDPDAVLIGLEPQPRVVARVHNTTKLPPSRLVMLPMAVAAEPPGFVTFNVGKDNACSSFLVQRRAKGQAPNRCFVRDGAVKVPTTTLARVLALVPPELDIPVVSIDAQGFDAHVAATVSPLLVARKVDYLVLECQDLHHGSPKFIVGGAPNCADAVACVRAWYGYAVETCELNNRLVSELNCYFRRLTDAGGSSTPTTATGVTAAADASFEFAPLRKESRGFVMPLRGKRYPRPRVAARWNATTCPPMAPAVRAFNARPHPTAAAPPPPLSPQ